MRSRQRLLVCVAALVAVPPAEAFRIFPCFGRCHHAAGRRLRRFASTPVNEAVDLLEERNGVQGSSVPYFLGQDRPSNVAPLTMTIQVEDDVGDWSSMTVKQLKEQLKERGLTVSGKKAVLIERLEAFEATGGVAAENLNQKATTKPKSSKRKPTPPKEQPQVDDDSDGEMVLISDKVLKGVPQEAIKGAVMTAAAVSAVATKSVAFTGAASLGAFYAAISQGGAGVALRTVGGMAWDVAHGLADAYKKIDKDGQLQATLSKAMEGVLPPKAEGEDKPRMGLPRRKRRFPRGDDDIAEKLKERQEELAQQERMLEERKAEELALAEKEQARLEEIDRLAEEALLAEEVRLAKEISQKEAAIDEMDAKEALLQSVDDLFDDEEEEEPVATAQDWSKLTVPKLKAELAGRGLPVSGRKAELVAALEADDMETAVEEEVSDEFLDETEDFFGALDTDAFRKAALEVDEGVQSAASATEDDEEISFDEHGDISLEDFDMEAFGQAAREAEMFAESMLDDDEPSDDALWQIEQEPTLMKSEEASYATMTVPTLKDELRERGLPVSGRKVDLIERLQLDDNASR